MPELKWMLVGERVSSGFSMYQGIYDDMGPLSSVVYGFIDLLFGRSHGAYLTFGLILVFVQAAIFNQFLLANKAYRENTYVPAFIYGVFMCYSFDFFLLSPQLMSLTFILLSLNNIFKRIDNKTKDELFLNTGIYLGISVLFYFPTWVLFFAFLIILILFSNALPRRLFLMSIGFILVLGLAMVYYFLTDKLEDFIIQFIFSHWQVEQLVYVDGWDLTYLGILPMIFLIVSFLKIYGSHKYVNFQLKFQQAMLFLALGSIIIFWHSNELTSLAYLFLVPSLAFFGAHFLLLIRRALWIHIATVLMLAIIWFSGYFAFKGPEEVKVLVGFDKYFVESDIPDILIDKRILVTGDELNLYQNSTPATPFINWRISKKQFEQLDYYDNSSRIMEYLTIDPPEYIVDTEACMDKVFKRIPALAIRYTEVPGYPGYYRLISN